MEGNKIEYMSLDEAWNLVGEACFAYQNEQVRHALMLVRSSVADMRTKLGEIPDIFN